MQFLSFLATFSAITQKKDIFYPNDLKFSKSPQETTKSEKGLKTLSNISVRKWGEKGFYEGGNPGSTRLPDYKLRKNNE